MIENVKIEEINPDGTKKEINTDPASGYHNYLVSFNTIFDLDFSILRMIQAEYNNPKFVDQKIMHMTTKEVKSELLNREDENPISICINNKTVADAVYNEIMKSRFDDLLSSKYITLTGIFFMLSVYSAMDNVHVTVICKSKIEEETVRKYHKNIKTIITEDLSTINVDEYTEFIFKHKHDPLKFKQKFNEKRIILLNYKFNTFFKDNIVFPDLAISYYMWENGYSKVAIIDTYSKNDSDYAGLKFKKPVKNKTEN